MDLDQLTDHYVELRRALARAYERQPWESQRIDHLADQLLSIERDIAAQRARAVRKGTLPSAGSRFASSRR